MKKTLVGDFETTVYDGQTETEVWASALVELYTEDVQIFNSIDKTFDYLKKLNCDILLYYHNLAFDGSFWLVYLLDTLKYKQAYIQDEDDKTHGEFLKTKDMPANSIKYMISEQGKYYTITIKTENHTIEMRDSLKLLPYSVERMGKSFKTKHQKLSMEYTGFRQAGGNITEEEQKYIANDVLVVKECLEHMYNNNHTKMTIGSCCMKEFKELYPKDLYNEFFPDLKEYPLDKNIYGYDNAYDYIHRSYKGGWCYVVKGCENKVYENGCTADVNSLYPSVMHSSSGNRYPVGLPRFWHGNYIPKQAKRDLMYYFITIECKFVLKNGMLPFIQIKNSFRYRGNEYLENSFIRDKKTGLYHDKIQHEDGTIEEVKIKLTLTMTDYKMLKKHYHVYDCKILHGCYFTTEIGLFDKYIDPWKEKKQHSKGAEREEAKLFMNNLYGKLATNDNSSFKIVEVEDGIIRYKTVVEHNKKVGYIPIGSAITSYARHFTISHAQKNFFGADKKGFKYADTDSIHCDCEEKDLIGIEVHPTEFNHWKIESYWDKAIFVRQKTYIEHITHEDGEEVQPYYNIKCAGLGGRSRKLIDLALQHKYDDKCNEEEKAFIDKGMVLEDFKAGLKVPSDLRPQRIKGGILLVSQNKKIR